MNGARRVGLAAGGRRVLHVHGSTIIQYIASVSTVPMGKTKLLVRGALHRAGRARWLEPTEAGPGLARCARGLSYRPARREPGVLYLRHLARGGCATGSTAAQGAA
jgi:hypothetical protein